MEDAVGLSPKDILLFAKQILPYLFLLVMLVFALSDLSLWHSPENEALFDLVTTILDITKTAVPSIVTWVLGFLGTGFLFRPQEPGCRER